MLEVCSAPRVHEGVSSYATAMSAAFGLWELIPRFGFVIGQVLSGGEVGWPLS